MVTLVISQQYSKALEWDSSSPATFFTHNISISEHKPNAFEITDKNLYRFKQI
jgi:hypothetical protein